MHRTSLLNLKFIVIQGRTVSFQSIYPSSSSFLQKHQSKSQIRAFNESSQSIKTSKLVKSFIIIIPTIAQNIILKLTWSNVKDTIDFQRNNIHLDFVECVFTEPSYFSGEESGILEDSKRSDSNNNNN